MLKVAAIMSIFFSLSLEKKRLRSDGREDHGIIVVSESNLSRINTSRAGGELADRILKMDSIDISPRYKYRQSN